MFSLKMPQAVEILVIRTLDVSVPFLEGEQPPFLGAGPEPQWHQYRIPCLPGDTRRAFLSRVLEHKSNPLRYLL